MNSKFTLFLLAIIVALSAILVARSWSGQSGYQFEATYFLEVKQSDAMNFTHIISGITGRGLGYFLGTSEMMSIPTDGNCLDNDTLDEALREYIESNQFVCFLIAKPIGKN